MNNIVERWTLGCYAPGKYHCICSQCSQQFIGDKRAITCLPCAAKQADDEITRLTAEVERLTNTSNAAKENRDGLLKAMLAKDAEVERLRAALERIAYGKYHWEADAQEEARAALAQEKQDDP